VTATGVGAVVVAGLGSEHRRDDAVGPVVAARAAEVAARHGVRLVAPLGDPLDLLGYWDGAALAVIVDALHSGAAPGSVRVVELGPEAGRDGMTRVTHPPASTHGIDLGGVLRLSAAVGRAPRRVVVVGIEGGDFTRGTGLSPAVAAAVPSAVERVVHLIEESTTCV